MDKNMFEQSLKKDLLGKYDTTIENALDWQLHECVSAVVMEDISEKHSASVQKHLGGRRAMYLSMEFLMGRAVHNNLFCAGIYDDVESVLNAHGRSLDDLETIEDAALGNGGLGRLAACFLDSAAALDLPLDGYGIRYKYGLFKQKIVDGFQKEEADDWSKYGDPWSKRCDQDSVLVKYADQTVKAVPYDMPIIGYGTDNIGTLRLWQAEAEGGFDELEKYLTIQLNDTHPVIAVPELIRQLCEQGYDFDTAFDKAHKIFNYTNHTIMAEALEKWRCSLVESILPDVYTYILMINERFIKDMYQKGMERKAIEKIQPVSDGMVNMAYMAIYVSSFVNGVAQIHTEILKTDALKPWYDLYPERFQNKTNGITQRRWLALCNKELSALITRLLGDDAWITDLDRLKQLAKYADDEAVLREFINIKKTKKQQLADFIKAHDGIDVDPGTVFDIQIKRLHEYKRQLLNALSIIYIYYGIKDGSIKDFTPTTFIFGAKSAPGYRRAKAIIKLLGEVGKMVNSDEQTKDLLKVVFVQNYNVSYAQKLVPAADISEQISTAGTEASGTGNMKLMLNGAVTLGTYDGANVEIVQEAGEENNYIFGARVEELAQIMPSYDPRKLIFENEKINRVLNKLIDGTFDDGGVPSDQEGSFKELYKALTDGASWHVPDHYYVVGDLESYVQAKLKCSSDYKDELAFAKKCWLNMCNAGKFSSDRTIKDYAENIWKIVPVSK